MKTREHGIKGLAYREDRAAEQLGISIHELEKYADRLGVEKRRMYGYKGAWFTAFEMDDIADLMGLKDRKWNNPMRGYRLPGSIAIGDKQERI